jgi:hypothetical protein
MNTYLTRLCENSSWSLVEERCSTFPSEATPSEDAIKGHGSTALSLAIRLGAPLVTIQYIADADQSQLFVVHKMRGTIFHDALRHSSVKILKYLLSALQQHGSSDLLSKTDDLKRTPLHYLVLYAMRALPCPGTYWIVFREMVLTHPDSLSCMDCDGNTPLLLLLLNQDVYRQDLMSEAHIFRMVQLMVTVRPNIATLCRNAPCEWVSRKQENGTIGHGVATPLTYAMLYGRSEETIGVLLDASKKVGCDSCMTLVSGYREVPLHLAVSLRSSISMLKKILDESPQAVNVLDVYDLTPLDWLWIRHVLDWCNQASSPFPPVSPSTRRYLAQNFLDLYSIASREEPTQAGIILQETLWQRMRILLPAYASVTYQQLGLQMPEYEMEVWSMTHAACFAKCPLVMVRYAVRREGLSILRHRDFKMRRMPLHYACSRPGYNLKLPVGAMSEYIQTISEASPVTEIVGLFPEASRVSDINGQLPLHIAIDTARLTGLYDWDVFKLLLNPFPESLERRDGKSKLFPFMQAALDSEHCLDIIYLILLENPAILNDTICCGSFRTEKKE